LLKKASGGSAGAKLLPDLKKWAEQTELKNCP